MEFIDTGTLRLRIETNDALAVYRLVGYTYDDRMENLVNRKHRQTGSTAVETRKR